MGGTEERVVQILDAPGGKVQAVRVNREAGATVSDSVYIYIVPKGERLSWTTRSSIRLNRYSDVTMNWGSERELNITYRAADVLEFEKTWNSLEVDGGRYHVQLNLKQKP